MWDFSHKFISFFLLWSYCFAWVFSSCHKQVPICCNMRLFIGGFLVAEYTVLGLRASVAEAIGLSSCSLGPVVLCMWNLPGPGPNPSPVETGRFLPKESPVLPKGFILNEVIKTQQTKETFYLFTGQKNLNQGAARKRAHQQITF